ncbi:MAG: hypothetical protein E7284_00295 [Lachnospiraceae bacterium]|nr:hypothetical protein [Lachnospiraceae bacterium]
MYEIFEIAVVAMIAVLGLFMALFPKLATKKSEREIEYAVKDTRKRGIILTVVGIICAIVVAVLNFMR